MQCAAPKQHGTFPHLPSPPAQVQRTSCRPRRRHAVSRSLPAAGSRVTITIRCRPCRAAYLRVGLAGASGHSSVNDSGRHDVDMGGAGPVPGVGQVLPPSPNPRCRPRFAARPTKTPPPPTLAPASSSGVDRHRTASVLFVTEVLAVGPATSQALPTAPANPFSGWPTLATTDSSGSGRDRAALARFASEALTDDDNPRHRSRRVPADSAPPAARLAAASTSGPAASARSGSASTSSEASAPGTASGSAAGSASGSQSSGDASGSSRAPVSFSPFSPTSALLLSSSSSSSTKSSPRPFYAAVAMRAFTPVE